MTERELCQGHAHGMLAEPWPGDRCPDCDALNRKGLTFAEIRTLLTDVEDYPYPVAEARERLARMEAER